MRSNSARFLWLFEVLNFLFNYEWFYRLIGRFNSKGWIKSVFLSYPANREFAKNYGYDFRIGSWDIRLSTFLRQNNKIVIMFTVFVYEEDFLKKENAEKLSKMVQDMEKIRQLIGAEEKTFAGILPGLLSKRKLVDKTPEADITASIVADAVKLVKKEMNMNEYVWTIVLGGKGFIGKRVVARLRHFYPNIRVIDVGDKDKWPEGRSSNLIVNLARHDTIQQYYDLLQSGDVVLNEAYPAPGPEILSTLKSLGCSCFHVVGVEASAFPRFTSAYSKGAPCCAAWNSKRKKVMIEKLT